MTEFADGFRMPTSMTSRKNSTSEWKLGRTGVLEVKVNDNRLYYGTVTFVLAQGKACKIYYCRRGVVQAMHNKLIVYTYTVLWAFQQRPTPYALRSIA